MKRVLLLLLLALTACGVRPSVPIEGDPAPTEAFADETVLYLIEGTTLTRVVRPSGTASPLDLLAAGPTSEELAVGLTTQVPPYAAPITRSPALDGITVRISSALRYLSPLAQSQLVCTALGVDQDISTEVTLTDPTETLPPQWCPFRA